MSQEIKTELTVEEKNLIKKARRRRLVTTILRLSVTHFILLIIATLSAVPLLLIVLSSLLPYENDFLAGNFVKGLQYLPQFILDIPSILLAAISGFNAFIDGIEISSFAKVMRGVQWGADPQPFSTFLYNSLYIAVLASTLSLFVSITSAYALSRMKFHGRTLTLGAMLLTQMFPLVVLLIPYLRFFGEKGLNLIGTGGGREVLIIIYAGTGVPFMTWMIKGFFDSIDEDIEKAAIIDGCDRLEVIYRITLPLAKPGIAATLMYSFLVGWNELMFALAFLITDPSLYTLPIGLINAQYVSENNILFIPIATYSLAVAVPAILVFIITQRYMVSGLTAGATKR